MNDIGIGAVGAAIIAGLISLLGLIIGKEQKVSEFRQSWIDELRKCLVAYLVNINAIADALRVAKSNGEKPVGIEQNYQLLNEANHGIKLRVNDNELTSRNLLDSMEKFEKLAENNSKLNPDHIKEIEGEFLANSKELLKFEWSRVKKGEKTYYTTKYIVITLIVIMLIIFAYLWQNRDSNLGPEPQILDNSAYFNSTSCCRHNVCLVDMVPSCTDPESSNTNEAGGSPNTASPATSSDPDGLPVQDQKASEKSASE